MSYASPGKYLPLCGWLAAQPEVQASVRLNEAEILTLLGASLPAIARSSLFWSESGITV